MELSDFQRRLLGFPAQILGGVTSALTADPNAPVEQQDMANARWGTLGQMGALLFAAGQPQTDQSRAAMLSRLASVSTPDELAMTAAQRRMMQMRGQQAQTEMQRQQMLRDRLNDPAVVKALGLQSPEQAQYLGDEGIRKLLENQALQNTPEAMLERQVKQAQLDALRGPKIGPIGQDVDGNTIYGDQRTGTPMNATPAAPAAGATGVEAPAGVNPREFRKKQADLAAASAATEAAQKKYIEEQFNPALSDYDKAVRDGIGAGAFGPVGASAPMRALTAFSGAEAARQRVEQAGNRLAFELAKRSAGGKLDSKGLTDTELKKYSEQLVPLYANNPQVLLEALEKNYGFTPPSSQPAPQTQAGSDQLATAREAIRQGAPREAVIQRLRENGIDTTGL
jgi:hypothetical protein